MVAAVFEFGGSVLVGSHVTDTIRSGIIETSLFEPDVGRWAPTAPCILALGMFCALLAAGIWLQIATLWGLPVSTTHAIVGAVVGFGVLARRHRGRALGRRCGTIVLSWVVSPLMGGLIAWPDVRLHPRRHPAQPRPGAAARRVGPCLVGSGDA